MNQVSSTDVMYCETFLGLQVPLDQLRPHEGCLVGFTGDHMEVQGYADLRITFLDKHVTITIVVRYMVVNAPSSYNLLLERPSLNKLKAVPSSYHKKVKLPLLEGKVITLKVDKKIAQKCYESSLRNRRGMYMVATTHGVPDIEINLVPDTERRPGPVGRSER